MIRRGDISIVIPSRRRLAAALAGLIAFEAVAVPIAQAKQFESLWETRAAARRAGDRAENPLLASSRLIDTLPSLRGPAPLKPSVAPSFSDEFKHLPVPLRDLAASVPAAAATIREIHASSALSSEPPVVILQDVHMNSEAQLNLAAVIEGVARRQTVSVIGAEGTDRPFDFSVPRRLAEPALRAELARAFVTKKLMGAVSYAGLSSAKDLPITGVDEPSLYEANVQAYRAAHPLKERALRGVEGLARSVSEEKARNLSAPLLAFDALRENYHAGRVTLGDYLRKLSALSPDAELVLEQFVQAYEMEKSLDFERADRERRHLLSRLVGALEAAEVSELADRSLAYRAGTIGFGAYYRHLKALCARKGVSLAQTPEFDKYVRYVLLSDGIRAGALFDAMRRREADLVRLFARTPEDAALMARSELALLARKLVGFELTPDEWLRYRELSQNAPGRAGLAPFELFYETADARSHAMIDRLLARGAPGGVRLMVTGGFHTTQMIDLLRRRGIPCLVVTPKLIRLSDEPGSAYLSEFSREKTPLEKMFSGSRLFVLPSSQLPFGADVPATEAAFNAMTQVPALRAGRKAARVGDLVVRRGRGGLADVELSDGPYRVEAVRGWRVRRFVSTVVRWARASGVRRWLARLLATRRQEKRRLGLERLEDRSLPATTLVPTPGRRSVLSAPVEDLSDQKAVVVTFEGLDRIPADQRETAHVRVGLVDVDAPEGAQTIGATPWLPVDEIDREETLDTIYSLMNVNAEKADDVTVELASLDDEGRATPLEFPGAVEADILDEAPGNAPIPTFQVWISPADGSGPDPVDTFSTESFWGEIFKLDRLQTLGWIRTGPRMASYSGGAYANVVTLLGGAGPDSSLGFPIFLPPPTSLFIETPVPGGAIFVLNLATGEMEWVPSGGGTGITFVDRANGPSFKYGGQPGATPRFSGGMRRTPMGSPARLLEGDVPEQKRAESKSPQKAENFANRGKGVYEAALASAPEIIGAVIENLPTDAEIAVTFLDEKGKEIATDTARTGQDESIVVDLPVGARTLRLTVTKGGKPLNDLKPRFSYQRLGGVMDVGPRDESESASGEVIIGVPATAGGPSQYLIAQPRLGAENQSMASNVADGAAALVVETPPSSSIGEMMVVTIVAAAMVASAQRRRTDDEKEPAAGAVTVEEKPVAPIVPPAPDSPRAPPASEAPSNRVPAAAPADVAIADSWHAHLVTTADGTAWLRDNKNFLTRPEGAAFLRNVWRHLTRTAAGQAWLRDNLFVLDSVAARRLITTPDGQHWLRRFGFTWLATTASGRSYLTDLKTPVNARFLRLPAGHAWLSLPQGRDWLKTAQGRRWLATADSREWINRLPDWLATADGFAYLRANLDWLSTERGRAYLATENGRRWLATADGSAWFLLLGSEFAASEAGLAFLATPAGLNLVTRHPEWLLTAPGASFLRSSLGLRWLNAHLYWLRTTWGLIWLRSEDGAAWQQTDDGRAWLAALAPQLGASREWLEYFLTPDGAAWLFSDDGLLWLTSPTGVSWLKSDNGRRWLLASSTPLLPVLGRAWFIAKLGLNLAQVESLFGKEWATNDRPWASVLDRYNRLDMLAFIFERSGLDELLGAEWIRANFGASTRSSHPAVHLMGIAAAVLTLGFYGDLSWGIAAVIGTVTVIIAVTAALIARRARRNPAATPTPAASAPPASAYRMTSLAWLTFAATFGVTLAALALREAGTGWILAFLVVAAWVAVPLVVGIRGSGSYLFNRRASILGGFFLAASLWVLIALPAGFIRVGAVEKGDRAAQVIDDESREGAHVGVEYRRHNTGPTITVDLDRAPDDTLDRDLLRRAVSSEDIQKRIRQMRAIKKTMELKNLPIAHRGPKGADAPMVFTYEFRMRIEELIAAGETGPAIELFLQHIAPESDGRGLKAGRIPRNYGALVVSFYRDGRAFEREVRMGEMLHISMAAFHLFALAKSASDRENLLRIGKDALDYALQYQDPDTGRIAYGPTRALDSGEFQADLCGAAKIAYQLLGDEKYRKAFEASLLRLRLHHYDGVSFVDRTAAPDRARAYAPDVAPWLASMTGWKDLEDAGFDVPKLIGQLGEIPGDELQPDLYAPRLIRLAAAPAYLRQKAEELEKAGDPRAAALRAQAREAEAAVNRLASLLFSLEMVNVDRDGETQQGLSYLYRLRSGAKNKWSAASWTPAGGSRTVWGIPSPEGISWIPKAYLLMAASGFDPVAGVRPDGRRIDWREHAPEARRLARVLAKKDPVFDRDEAESWRLDRSNAVAARARRVADAAAKLISDPAARGLDLDSKARMPRDGYLLAIIIEEDGSLREVRGTIDQWGTNRLPRAVYGVIYTGSAPRNGPPTRADREAGILAIENGIAYTLTPQVEREPVLGARAFFDGRLGGEILVNPRIVPMSTAAERAQARRRISWGMAILAGQYIGGLVVDRPVDGRDFHIGTLSPRPMQVPKEYRTAIQEALSYFDVSTEEGRRQKRAFETAWLTETSAGERHEDYPVLRSIAERLYLARADDGRADGLDKEYVYFRNIAFGIADIRAALVQRYGDNPPARVRERLAAYDTALQNVWIDPMTGNTHLVGIGKSEYGRAVEAENRLARAVSDEKNQARRAELARALAELRGRLEWAVEGTAFAGLPAGPGGWHEREYQMGAWERRFYELHEARLRLQREISDLLRDLERKPTRQKRERLAELERRYDEAVNNVWRGRQMGSLTLGVGQALRWNAAHREADQPGASERERTPEGHAGLLGVEEPIYPTTLSARYTARNSLVQTEAGMPEGHDEFGRGFFKVTEGNPDRPYIEVIDRWGRVIGQLHGKNLRIKQPERVADSLREAWGPYKSTDLLEGENLVFLKYAVASRRAGGEGVAAVERIPIRRLNGVAFKELVSFVEDGLEAGRLRVSVSVRRPLDDRSRAEVTIFTAKGIRRVREQHSVPSWSDSESRLLLSVDLTSGEQTVNEDFKFSRAGGRPVATASRVVRDGLADEERSVSIDQRTGRMDVVRRRKEGSWGLPTAIERLVRRLIGREDNETVDEGRLTMDRFGQQLSRHDAGHGNNMTLFDPDEEYRLRAELEFLGVYVDSLPTPSYDVTIDGGVVDRRFATYRADIRTDAEGRFERLVVTRRVVDGNGVLRWTSDSYEAAPIGAVDAFGRSAGALRLRTTESGVTQGTREKPGADVVRWRTRVVYEDDQEKPAALERMARKEERRTPAPGRPAEFGRVVSEVSLGAEGEREAPQSYYLNMGIAFSEPELYALAQRGAQDLTPEQRETIERDRRHREEKEPTALLVKEFRPGSLEPANVLVLRNGERAALTMTLRGTQVVPAARAYNPLTGAMAVEAGVAADPLSPGYIARDTSARNGFANTRVDQEVKTVRAADLFLDAPRDLLLFKVVERPTSITGDPAVQAVTSYYDQNGRLWLQVQGSGSSEIRRVSYFPQLGATQFPHARNEAIAVPQGGRTPTSKADFISFFVTGPSADDVRVRVTDRTGKTVTLDNAYLISRQERGLWHQDLSDPIIQQRGAGKAAKYRIINAAAQAAGTRLLPTGSAPRPIFIPIAWLLDQGIDVNSMSLQVLSGSAELRVSAPQRLADPNVSDGWALAPQVQQRVYPRGVPDANVREDAPGIYDQGHGIVTVVSGRGTSQRSMVYDHGNLTSITYWQLSGREYQQVRVWLSRASSAHLQFPEYTVSPFGGWVGGVITIEEMGTGRIARILPLNPDAATESRLARNDRIGSVNDVEIVAYTQFGLSLRGAAFENASSNILNALLLRRYPGLNPILARFGGDIFNIPPRLLEPLGLRLHIQNAPSEVPLSFARRDTPQTAEANAGRPRVMSGEEWTDRVRAETSKAGLLPDRPRTRFDDVTDEAANGRIGAAAARRGAVDAARKLLEHTRRATRNGATAVGAGATVKTGAPLQVSEQYDAVGGAVPTLSATAARALHALEVALRTGDARDLDLALNLTRRTLEFVPDTDYFWSKNADGATSRPAEVRAKLLLEAFRSVQSAGGIELNDAIEQQVLGVIRDAQRELAASPEEAARIRNRHIEALVEILCVNADEATALRGLLLVAGGFSEYRPLRPISLLRGAVILSPEPDVFEVNRDVLVLLRRVEGLLAKATRPSERDLLRQVRVHRATFEEWLKANVLAVAAEHQRHLKQAGLAAPHERELRARVGNIHAYVVAPGKTPSAAACLSLAEITLELYDYSPESVALVKTWLGQYHRLFGDPAGRRGLRFTHAVGFSHEMFSSLHTARFGLLSWATGYEPGLRFARRALPEFVNEGTGALREAIVPGAAPRDGLPTGDGRRIYLDPSGLPSDSLEATDAAIRLEALVAAGEKANPAMIVDGPHEQPDAALIEAARDRRQSAEVEKAAAAERLKDIASDTAVQAGLGFWAFLGTLAFVFTFGTVGRFKGDVRLAFTLRLVRDSVLLAILLAPFGVIFALLGTAHVSFAMMGVWATFALPLISAEIWFLINALRMMSIPPVKEEDSLYTNELQELHEDRFYRRVMGAYQSEKYDAAEGTPEELERLPESLRASHPTELIGNSVPRQLQPANLGGHVGSAEFLFLPGLKYIHLFTLQMLGRYQGYTDDELSAADEPFLNGRTADLAEKIDDPDADLAGEDPHIQRLQKLRRLDRSIRLAAEWFTKRITEDHVDTRMYARATLYFSDVSERLRQILIRMHRRSPGDPDYQRNIDRDIEEWETILNEVLLSKLNLITPSPTPRRAGYTLAEDRFDEAVERFSTRRYLYSIPTYWLNKIRWVPKLVTWIVSFAFIYAFRSGAESPVDILANNFHVLPVNGLLIAALGVAALAALLLSIWFYWNGNQMGVRSWIPDPLNERLRRRGFEVTGPSGPAPVRRFIESAAGRALLSAGLLAGILATALVAPGLGQNILSGLAAWTGVAVAPMPVDLISLLIPLTVMLLLASEILALWTGRLSLVGSIIRYHFGPATAIGSGRTVLNYLFQHALFLGLAWWMSEQVGNFFKGFLANLDLSTALAEQGFRFDFHIGGSLIIAFLFVWFAIQMLKLKEYHRNPKDFSYPAVKAAEKPDLKLAVVSAITAPMALVGWFVALPPVVPVLGLGIPLGGLANPLLGLCIGALALAIFAAAMFHGNIKPSTAEKFTVGVLGTLILGLVFYGLVVYRPVGGIVVGGLVALVIALTLANASIYSLFSGIATFARESGRPMRLFVEVIPVMLILGVFAGGFNAVVPGLALPGNLLGLIPALPPFVPALLIGLFIFLLYTTLVASGHPGFAPLLTALGIAGFGVPVFVPGFALAVYFQWAFAVVLAIAIVTRIARVVMKSRLEKKLLEFDASEVDDESFGVLLTGGQPLGSPALTMGVEGALKAFMTMYEDVIQPNSVPSDREIIGQDGRPLNVAGIKKAMRFLYEQERARGVSLLGEDAIGYPGKPLTTEQLAIQAELRAYVQDGVAKSMMFDMASEEEAETLRIALRIKNNVVSLTGVGASQFDSMLYLNRLSVALKSAGLHRKIKIYFQSNKFDRAKPELQANNRGPRRLFSPGADAGKLVEFDERLAMANYIRITSGIAVETVHNWTQDMMKSGAQNGNSGSFRNLRKLLILDRNAQTFDIFENVMDTIHMMADDRITAMFPLRSTSSEIFVVGVQSGLGEYGFSMAKLSGIEDLGEYNGEMMAIGWGTMVDVPIHKLTRALANPNRAYQFDPNASFLSRLMGLVHAAVNFPHVSEDILQTQNMHEVKKRISMVGEDRFADKLSQMLLQAGASHMRVSRSFYYKMRESASPAEMPGARERWAAGGDIGQKGSDIFDQITRFWGTDSIFIKEVQANRARYYSLAIIGMLNVFMTPILVLAGYTPFAGILLLFWGIGLVANQVLTLNGWGTYIHRAGFWAGTAMWLSERFRDTILFAYLGFIELYGVLHVIMKGIHYSYTFVISGGTAINVYRTNDWEVKIQDAARAHLFRWIFMMGLAGTALNIYAIAQLGLLNAWMLYPSLIFTYGLMIGPYVFQHQKGPGWSPFNVLRWLPKVLGAAVAIVGLALTSIGAGGLVPANILTDTFHPFGMLIGMDALFIVGLAFLVLMVFLVKNRPSLRAWYAAMPSGRWAKVRYALDTLWGYAALVVAVAAALVFSSHVPILSALAAMVGIDPGLHIVLPMGIALIALMFPGRNHLLRVGADFPADKNFRGEQRFHNTWVFVIWASAAVSLFLLGSGFFGTLGAAGATWASLLTLNWFSGLAIASPLIIKVANMFFNLDFSGPVFFRSPWSEWVAPDKPGLINRSSAVRDEPNYFWDSFTRTGVIWVGALIWFLIVPAPGLVSLRVNDFNMTLSYAVIVQLVVILGVGLTALVATGFTLFSVRSKVNSARYRRLLRRYRARMAPGGGGVDSALSGVVDAAIQGYKTAINTRAPITAGRHLDDLEEALNTPRDPSVYFGGRRPDPRPGAAAFNPANPPTGGNRMKRRAAPARGEGADLVPDGVARRAISASAVSDDQRPDAGRENKELAVSDQKTGSGRKSPPAREGRRPLLTRATALVLTVAASLAGSEKKSAARSIDRPQRPGLETLEDRTAPAVVGPVLASGAQLEARVGALLEPAPVGLSPAAQVPAADPAVSDLAFMAPLEPEDESNFLRDAVNTLDAADRVRDSQGELLSAFSAFKADEARESARDREFNINSRLGPDLFIDPHGLLVIKWLDNRGVDPSQQLDHIIGSNTGGARNATVAPQLEATVPEPKPSEEPEAALSRPTGVSGEYAVDIRPTPDVLFAQVSGLPKDARVTVAFRNAKGQLIPIKDEEKSFVADGGPRRIGLPDGARQIIFTLRDKTGGPVKLSRPLKIRLESVGGQAQAPQEAGEKTAAEKSRNVNGSALLPIVVLGVVAAVLLADWLPLAGLASVSLAAVVMPPFRLKMPNVDSLGVPSLEADAARLGRALNVLENPRRRSREDVAAALAVINETAPLGVVEFGRHSRRDLIHQRYLARFAKARPVSLNADMESSVELGRVEKILFTPKGTTPEARRAERARLEASLPGDLSRYEIVEMSERGWESLARRASTDGIAAIADELLATRRGRAARVRILVAQGARMPESARWQMLLGGLEGHLSDRLVLGMLLADMIRYVPLKAAEMPSLKAYERVASQA